jgi:hypothetical protein
LGTRHAKKWFFSLHTCCSQLYDSQAGIGVTGGYLDVSWGPSRPETSEWLLEGDGVVTTRALQIDTCRSKKRAREGLIMIALLR